MNRKLIPTLAILVAASIPVAVSAQDAPVTRSRAVPPDSTVMVYAGTTAPTNGYPERTYGGVMADVYTESGIGIHADLAAVTREDDAAYASIGLSYTIEPGVRPRITVGTSTNTRNIFPQVYVAGQVRIEADKSTIVTPAFAWRSYRTGVNEYTPSLDVAHYFTIDGDSGGYYAVQGRGSVSFIDRADTGYSIGGGVLAARKSGVTAGVYGEYGHLSYSGIYGMAGTLAPGLKSDFWSIRPSLGTRLGANNEIFVRGEYSHNKAFDTRGVFAGFKTKIQ